MPVVMVNYLLNEFISAHLHHFGESMDCGKESTCFPYYLIVFLIHSMKQINCQLEHPISDQISSFK